MALPTEPGARADQDLCANAARPASLTGPRDLSRRLVLLLAAELALAGAAGLLDIRILPAGWVDASVLVTAALAVAAVLLRALPAQNVLFLAVSLTGFGSGLTLVAPIAGLPFAPVHYQENTGPILFGLLPWFVPVLWFAGVAGGRVLARQVLKPWRRHRWYGFMLLGVAAVSACLLWIAIDAYGVSVRHYWRWPESQYRAVSWCLWWLFCAAALFLLTPWFISKKP